MFAFVCACGWVRVRVRVSHTRHHQRAGSTHATFRRPGQQLCTARLQNGRHNPATDKKTHTKNTQPIHVSRSIHLLLATSSPSTRPPPPNGVVVHYLGSRRGGLLKGCAGEVDEHLLAAALVGRANDVVGSPVEADGEGCSGRDAGWDIHADALQARSGRGNGRRWGNGRRRRGRGRGLR